MRGKVSATKTRTVTAKGKDTPGPVATCENFFPTSKKKLRRSLLILYRLLIQKRKHPQTLCARIQQPLNSIVPRTHTAGSAAFACHAHWKRPRDTRDGSAQPFNPYPTVPAGAQGCCHMQQDTMLHPGSNASWLFPKPSYHTRY